jgi:acyl dehydratase
MAEQSLAELAARAGEEVGVSRWITVDQAMIDAFADLTDDHQYIHVDPERTRRETALEGTIAHGFLTLSLLSPMSQDARPRVAGVTMSLNYGFDRVRFLSPVPAGARIRGRFVLLSAEETAPGEATLRWRATVEIEGQERPALVADWIGRHYLAGQAGREGSVAGFARGHRGTVRPREKGA